MLSDEVMKFIEESMKNWRVELAAGWKNLADDKIQRYIPGRCTITITICDSDETTWLHT